ncbi:hypothetical protein NLG97_g8606 [Lecanicillium saksenae]|uniref:Uncharacterized protein n=1 Tax=Lecanicillium saksenae TaxID=468837 RepID=A0ACC1QJM6_9HYPO|nr:hypothetical protein NLG97_g8606 [Lecanicillium saksenae]
MAAEQPPQVNRIIHAPLGRVTTLMFRVSSPWTGTAPFTASAMRRNSEDPVNTEPIDTAVITILMSTGIIQNREQLVTLSAYRPDQGITGWGMVFYEETGPEGQRSQETLLIVSDWINNPPESWPQAVVNIKRWFDSYNLVNGCYARQTKVEMLAPQVYWDLPTEQDNN